MRNSETVGKHFKITVICKNFLKKTLDAQGITPRIDNSGIMKLKPAGLNNKIKSLPYYREPTKDQASTICSLLKVLISAN